MNTIDTGLLHARATLNMSAVTLNVLAEALSRNSTTPRVLDVATSMRGVARNLEVAFELLVEAERLNSERFTSMQEEIRALNRQLNYIIEG